MNSVSINLRTDEVIVKITEDATQEKTIQDLNKKLNKGENGN